MSEMPPFQATMNPILEVLRAHPQPIPIEDLDRQVLERMALPPDLVAIPHDLEKPDRSEIAYRIAWARSRLKMSGYLINPKRGEWTVTDKGRSAGQIDVAALLSEQYRARRASSEPEGDDELEGESSDDEASGARVGRVLSRELANVYASLVSDGTMPSRAIAEIMHRHFMDRFGPSVLQSLDGPDLLSRMHGRGTKDSLVHWLEFKEDDDFTTSTFGSIAGGSALKFGLYHHLDSGAWMTGSAQQQTRLELDEAITLARKQRNQLLAAAQLLTPQAGSAAVDYAALQAAISAAAPDVSDSAWCHKVLAIWFPDALDPFHVEDYQAHHLRRLLKLPAEGRYANAGVFVGIARQLKMTLLELGRVLQWRNGGPYKTWRIGTRIDGSSAWKEMLRGGYAAVGWPLLGSLSAVSLSKLGKDAVKKLVEQHYPSTPSSMSRASNQIFAFARSASERDVVVAMDGEQVLGVGRITGEYQFVSGSPTPHRRPVKWDLSGAPWKLPETEGNQTTFIQLQRCPRNLIEVEARLLASHGGGGNGSVPPPEVGRGGVSPRPELGAPAPLPPLDGTIGRLHALLVRKRQAILYGPPGTGKTHWATATANEIVSRAWHGVAAADASAEQRRNLSDAAIQTVTFHPGYGYEDFLEGYRPTAGGFELRDGIFKRLCIRAAAEPSKPFVLIIDEINRGDIPRIFGELLTVLEKDKRGREVVLPLSGKAFAVPDNVYMIGTMNTADRSIALLDAALRRRFGFIELLPDTSLFKGVMVGAIPLGAWVEALNDKIVEHAGRDARNLRVGHAYFLGPGGQPIADLSRFAETLRDEIIPLLEEICYEDFDALERILGNRIVHRARKRIDAILFDPDHFDALQDAILQAFPTIVTAKSATEIAVQIDDDDNEEDVKSSSDGAETAA